MTCIKPVLYSALALCALLALSATNVCLCGRYALADTPAVCEITAGYSRLQLHRQPNYEPGRVIISEKSSSLGDLQVKVSVDQWQSEGNFRMLGGPPDAANRWELTHPVDGNILLCSIHISGDKVDAPYFLSYSLGKGAINNGIIRDTDWDANGTVSDLSYSTSRGENTLNLLKMGFRLTGDESFHPANRPSLYFTLGYFHLKQTARYYDPLMTISSYNPVNISWTENWDTYDLLYSGNEIGFTGHSMITSKLNLDISMGYIPSLIASYDGLRYPERVTSSQRPEEISATGDGFNYTIGLAYQPVKNLSIQAGYRYIHLWTQGEDQPGTSWSGSWEKLSTDLKGLSFGITYNF
jgi:opacity protein-like surface antigen